MGTSTVAGIVENDKDSAGATIRTVYAKVVPSYAVYRTDERVLVQYADSEPLGREQRRALIDSNPLKGEINGLIDGWRNSKWPSEVSRARIFDRRVADALVVALQGDQQNAVELLMRIKADILAERTSIARTSYLFTSCALTVLIAVIFAIPFGTEWKALGTTPGFGASLSLSAVVGALGAFFSIALAIRGRQIGTDLQWRDNHTDAGLRVVIGSISGAMLYCLLQAKFVSFGFGDAASAAASASSSAFLIVTAFAAGFTERLVGDLLGRAVLGATPSGANPLAGATTAPKNLAAAPPQATETNPMGRLAPPPPTEAGNPADTRPPPDPDEQCDGCHDHAELRPEELTQDVELPVASGGVVGRP